MAAIPNKQQPSPAYVEAVEEIKRIYKSLPPRPTIEEVEAAVSVVQTVDTEQRMKLEQISGQAAHPGVPPELFSVLQQARKTMVMFQSHEQRKEATQLVELDKIFQAFDELIQRASDLVCERHGDLGDEIGRESLISDFEEPKADFGSEGLAMSSSAKAEGDDGLRGLVKSFSTKATIFSPGDEVKTEKLDLMKVAALIENFAKSGSGILDLRGKLMDKIEWLPQSLGKLSNIHELDLSENRIMALPCTIGSLEALVRLDVHSNQVINLPDSFGDVVNLTHLDLHANRLKSLPPSFGNLTNLIDLDLSSNNFSHLPDVIGNLTCLRRLNVETNELEELPYAIGSCLSLVELRLNFNQLKALPGAIGKLGCLEVLTLHYNRIKGLPTTMGHLLNLKELNVSFNELESIPESLCFAASLVKLNVGNNFADLRALPKSIGTLELLEELDISDDQIRALPDSFRFLSKLRVFRADETPLELPPRQVTKLGARAVVEYMQRWSQNLQSVEAKKEEEEEAGRRRAYCGGGGTLGLASLLAKKNEV